MNSTIFIYDTIELSEDILTYAYRGRVLAYVTNACFVWLLWDWVINFDVEHRLIWQKRKTAASALYLFLRFWSCFLQGFILLMYDVRWTTSSSCASLKWMLCIGSFVQIIALQVLLQGRIYAIYNCSKKTLYVNFAVFVASIVGFAVAVIYQVPKMAPSLIPRSIVGCWSEISREILLVFIPLACYDLWLWALVVYKAFNRSQDVFARSSHFKSYPETILSVLLRDSTFWFTASVLLWIIIMLVLAYAPPGLNYVGIPLLLATTCIGGCRLVMNVRGAVYYSREDDEDTTEARGYTERPSGGNEGGVDTFRFASRSMLDEMDLGTERGLRDFDETEAIELRVLAKSPRSPSTPRPVFDPAWQLYRTAWTTHETRHRTNDEDTHWVTVASQTDERRSSWRESLALWSPSDAPASRFSPSSSNPIEIWVKEDYEVSAAGPSTTLEGRR